MAQMTQTISLTERIDRTLDSALGEWSGVPELAQEWPTWDEHSQFVFIMDWPVSEDRLYQLSAWAEQGTLSPKQEARYSELRELVERYRPVLTRLFEE